MKIAPAMRGNQSLVSNRRATRTGAGARTRVAVAPRAGGGDREGLNTWQTAVMAAAASVTPAMAARVAHAASISAPEAPAIEMNLDAESSGTSLDVVSAPSVVADVAQASSTETTQSDPGSPEGSEWRYKEFLDAVQNGKIERVRFSRNGQYLQATAVNGARAVVTLPNDPSLVDMLNQNNVDISVSEGQQQGNYAALIGNLIFPVLAFAGLFLLFRNSQQNSGDQSGSGGGMGGMGGMGGFGGGAMDFGKNKAKFQEVPETNVKFDDVAGAEGAKTELKELVDFLRSPDKYTSLGAKIPKGCLLTGPPGTGKTLIAKAVAGEAGVPFFSCAASEFVELFVGVGASRVRDLFEKAKQKSPCIIFIDEIDAVGRQRGAGMGGGNDEREQTINQLLGEMDGFEGNSGVLVIAATNRSDVLDSALQRPGRFDRQVGVDRPDVQGRIEILKVHAKGKKISADVDYDKVARRTPGFTGADLQNLMNEAAILAARRGFSEISKDEINDALEKLVAGAEKSGAVMSKEKQRLVAYHEAGHAVVGAMMPDYDSVSKISIVPRGGGAGGLTFFAPSEERLETGLYSRSYLENQMAVALGGRVAEEVIFGENKITTGASNDMQQVTQTARTMVSQMGFSDKLGQISWSSGGGPSFVGGSAGGDNDCSNETSAEIDSEVRSMVLSAYRRAKDCVQSNVNVLHDVAGRLMDRETMDQEEFEDIITSAGSQLYLNEDNPAVTVPYGASEREN